MAWSAKATPRGRLWWVLGPSARPTGATESGSSANFPTPTVMDSAGFMGQPDKGRTGPNSGNTLTGKVNRMWPTATGEDSEQSGPRRDGDRTLTSEARQWPTPNAHDGERGPESRETKQARGAGGINLNQAARQDWFTPQGRDWKDTGPTQGNRKDVNLGVQVHQTAPAGPPDPASRSTSGKSRDWCTPVVPGGGRTNRGPGRNHEPLFMGPIREETTGDRHHPGALNPRWVLQLMGYPSDWLDGVESPPQPRFRGMSDSGQPGGATASKPSATP